MDVLETITEAARNLHTVELDYQKVATGEIKHYVLEPYSTREGSYFFGYDIIEGKIKKFVIVNIISAQETEDSFSPRWAVEF